MSVNYTIKSNNEDLTIKEGYILRKILKIKYNKENDRYSIVSEQVIILDNQNKQIYNIISQDDPIDINSQPGGKHINYNFNAKLTEIEKGLIINPISGGNPLILSSSKKNKKIIKNKSLKHRNILHR